jgi:tetraacyldisaccharide 4'-kinase
MWKLIRYFLSHAYGLITAVRNRLYDFRILKSVEFDIPVISVGNITVGGTGKTPHIEYLIRLLVPSFRVAVLSRGYLRKTRGFRLVETTSSVEESGDEPLQVKRKFPGITVAVCEDRVTGVWELMQLKTPPDVVLLDDAFQHRKITPGISIVLIDYNKPLKEDHLLPFGRLRENPSQLRRANMIIMTKCPDEVTPITRRIVAKDVYLYPYQGLFFTKIKYGPIYPAFSEAPPATLDPSDKRPLLVVTGIASPEYLLNHLKPFASHMETLSFPDHHYFSRNDFFLMEEKFRQLKGSGKIIITTEKDLTRLTMEPMLPNDIRQVLYCLPMHIVFPGQEGHVFDKKIKDYVGENKINRELHFRKNSNKS